MATVSSLNASPDNGLTLYPGVKLPFADISACAAHWNARSGPSHYALDHVDFSANAYSLDRWRFEPNVAMNPPDPETCTWSAGAPCPRCLCISTIGGSTQSCSCGRLKTCTDS